MTSEPHRVVVPLLAGAVAPWFFLVALFDPRRGDVEAPAGAHLPAGGTIGVALPSVVEACHR